jgi:four helix bundle protein
MVNAAGGKERGTVGKQDLRLRTKQFALRVLALIDTLPRGGAAAIVFNQLGRCATAVGANYRAACKSRSRAEFIAKIGIVEEEADESAYWLEITIESAMLQRPVVIPVLTEANELVAIMAASRVTASRNRPPTRAAARRTEPP